MYARLLPLLALSASVLACAAAFAQTPDKQPHRAARASGQSGLYDRCIIINVLESTTNNEVKISPASQNLALRFPTNLSTGYAWNYVADPNCPLQLMRPPHYTPSPHKPGVVGSGGTTEYLFGGLRPASYARSFYLRFLSLRPFEKFSKDAKVWEIKVTIPAAPAAK